AFDSSGGSTSAHATTTREQRAWNRQPFGSSRIDGTAPGIGSSFSIELSNPAVYGCKGCAKSALVGALSTMRPAYITQTSSQSSETTERSCVIHKGASQRSRGKP